MNLKDTASQIAQGLIKKSMETKKPVHFCQHSDIVFEIASYFYNLKQPIDIFYHNENLIEICAKDWTVYLIDG